MTIHSFFRHTALLTVCLTLMLGGFAQNPPSSPAKTATGKVGEATVTVNYGSPSVKDRTIWGELVPYGKVWRTGANAATTFEVDFPITVEGQALPAGKYGLFTMPMQNEWTLIFNKTADQWGAYNYKESDDVLRVMVRPAKSDTFHEQLTFEVIENKLIFRWENLEVAANLK